MSGQGNQIGTRPELLAPAGDWECAKAAVENGADAIYFGLERFNARMRAHNFTVADLPELMAFLHRRGVRGYVTFNTLVFADELEDAERWLKSIIAAGVDAAIVQDVGICRLIRKLSPDFPIHASTQMTVTSAAGVGFAKELGCQLVVLARECSIKEIDAIKAAGESDMAGETSMPLEVFVHGALCVAYSGQCLTSESLGGRSANRGECAQACRMTYDLISDGEVVPLDDRRYLLSPQDLAGMDVLPDLVKSGVASLKIEGRLKTPEYVANITAAYNRALDAVCGPREGSKQEAVEDFKKVATDVRYDLEMGFSRGLYTGWFRGIQNQELAHARFGSKRGVFLGFVSEVRKNTVVVDLECALKAGDGVVFDAGAPDLGEEGGRVFTVDQKGRKAVLRFRDGAVQFNRIEAGDRVWKTSDPELEKRIRQTFDGDKIRFHRPIDFEVNGVKGQPLRVIAHDREGHIAQGVSESALVVAEKRPLNQEILAKQLGRLGSTPFALGELKIHLDGDLMLPIKELNELRRGLAEELDQQRAAPKRWTMSSEDAEVGLIGAAQDRPLPSETQLIVLVRKMEQLEAALEQGQQWIYCEFENPKRYRDAVALYREKYPDGEKTGAGIFVAPPRIFKSGEEWILKQVRSSNADGYLVRNYDHLKVFKDDRIIGDFSLNVANGITADYYLGSYPLERLTASYDLNIDQLTSLLASGSASRFEITIHQHMPMFHMEHCVFCAFMSTGKDYRDCGRPCEKHDVVLRDRIGAKHPLRADAGCRNTLFNSQAQTGAEFAEHMIGLGARWFRVEFLDEEPGAVKESIQQYRRLLNGEISGEKLWRQLRLKNQLGVTRGQLAGEGV